LPNNPLLVNVQVYRKKYRSNNELVLVSIVAIEAKLYNEFYNDLFLLILEGGKVAELIPGANVLNFLSVIYECKQ
jgi:hypothetical protein